MSIWTTAWPDGWKTSSPPSPCSPSPRSRHSAPSAQGCRSSSPWPWRRSAFTILGAVGLKYRTLRGWRTRRRRPPRLPVPRRPAGWPALRRLCGFVLYSSAIIAFPNPSTAPPPRSEKRNVANASAKRSAATSKAKCDFFDPGEDRMDEQAARRLSPWATRQRHDRASIQSPFALFYCSSRQTPPPRTAKCCVTTLPPKTYPERISSAHVDYQDLSERFQNTDIIFAASTACSKCGGTNLTATSLKPLCKQRLRLYSTRLGSAIRRLPSIVSLSLSGSSDNPDIRTSVASSLGNLGSVGQQFRRLQRSGCAGRKKRPHGWLTASPPSGWPASKAPGGQSVLSWASGCGDIPPISVLYVSSFVYACCLRHLCVRSPTSTSAAGYYWPPARRASLYTCKSRVRQHRKPYSA